MLLGNYNQWNANPGRESGGVTNSHVWLKPSQLMMFNIQDNPSESRKKSGFGEGYSPPYSWRLPIEAGSLSSHNETKILLDQSAALQGGKPVSGSTTITITADATGGLIVSGAGTAAITLSQSGVIQSIAAGSGSATIALTGSALCGALASISGQSSITLTPLAAVMAIGYLSGLSTNETEFSAAALASAVWNALTASYQIGGSFGEAMAAAGSAGDPWTTILPGSYVAGQAGHTLGSLVLTEADLNKIADTILRRATSSVEASSDGDAISIRSLYGMIAQGVHKTSVSGATLTVTKSDDTTTLATRTVTTDPSSEPITALDTN